MKSLAINDARNEANVFILHAINVQIDVHVNWISIVLVACLTAPF